MARETAIEYVDSSTNSVMGCSGCELYHPNLGKNHCYAHTLCHRYAGHKGWPKQFSKPEIFPARIPNALKWADLTGTDRPSKPWLNGYPRIIFINDLSDGFCPSVDPDDWLTPHINAMEESSHIWLLLTKWPDRMGKYFELRGGVPGNFWLGTSVLRQKDEWRVSELLRIHLAPVLFLSIEPQLETVDLDGICLYHHSLGLAYTVEDMNQWGQQLWIQNGGESGVNARPSHPDWFREVRDQCSNIGSISYFFKQHGIWIHESQVGEGKADHARIGLAYDSTCIHQWEDKSVSIKVGKKAAGRMLDGREWNEMPRWDHSG